MLFLAGCSEGFVRKLGEILCMAVSMWGAGYNRDSFSRQTHTHTQQIWVIYLWHIICSVGFRPVGVPGFDTRSENLSVSVSLRKAEGLPE